MQPNITQLPQEDLQSVQHMTTSILRPSLKLKRPQTCNSCCVCRSVWVDNKAINMQMWVRLNKEFSFDEDSKHSSTLTKRKTEHRRTSGFTLSSSLIVCCTRHTNLQRMEGISAPHHLIFPSRCEVSSCDGRCHSGPVVGTTADREVRGIVVVPCGHSSVSALIYSAGDGESAKNNVIAHWRKEWEVDPIEKFILTTTWRTIPTVFDR